MSDVVIVLSTAPDSKTAQALAQGLLQARLAACVSLLPATQSMYWWEGEIESAQEVTLLIKTAQPLAASVQDFIVKHHPYQTPEVVVLPVVSGLQKYLAWVEAETAPASRS